MSKKRKKKFTQEELTQKLLASREKVEKNRQELFSRGYDMNSIKLIKFMQKPTLQNAVRWNCYECSGYNWNEARNCKNKLCPLRPFAFKGRGNKKDIIMHYRQWMIESGELNPDLDVNIDFSNLFDEEEDAD